MQGKDIKQTYKVLSQMMFSAGERHSVLGAVEWCSVHGKDIMYKVLLNGVKYRRNILCTRYC